MSIIKPAVWKRIGDELISRCEDAYEEGSTEHEVVQDLIERDIKQYFTGKVPPCINLEDSSDEDLPAVNVHFGRGGGKGKGKGRFKMNKPFQVTAEEGSVDKLLLEFRITANYINKAAKRGVRASISRAYLQFISTQLMKEFDCEATVELWAAVKITKHF